jgi:hypothetical protein
MWVTWYHVLHCSGTIHLVPDHVAILPSIAHLLLHDVTADADVMCSSAACKRGFVVAVSADKTILAFSRHAMLLSCMHCFYRKWIQSIHVSSTVCMWSVSNNYSETSILRSGFYVSPSFMHVLSGFGQMLITALLNFNLFCFLKFMFSQSYTLFFESWRWKFTWFWKIQWNTGAIPLKFKVRPSI